MFHTRDRINRSQPAATEHIQSTADVLRDLQGLASGRFGEDAQKKVGTMKRARDLKKAEELEPQRHEQVPQVPRETGLRHQEAPEQHQHRALDDVAEKSKPENERLF